jgi:hypothetical protein
MSQLAYRHVAEVEDIIIAPPADEPHTSLADRIKEDQLELQKSVG